MNKDSFRQPTQDRWIKHVQAQTSEKGDGDKKD